MVLGFRDTPNQDGDPATILRKNSRYRFADKNIRKVGDLKTPLDRVIVGEGEKIHSGLNQLSVQLLGIGDACRHLQAAKQPFRGTETVTGVEMEIDACHEILRPI
jgi:hypothetical protein